MASLKEKKKKIFAFYTKFTEAVCFSSEKKRSLSESSLSLLLLLIIAFTIADDVTLSGHVRRLEKERIFLREM